MGSITLTRSGSTLTVSWNAVSDATKYHALYQADGAGDWLPPIPDYKNITATSFTFDIDSSKSYVVGVRAGNANGWGPWTDSPVSNPPLPAAVGSITLTRSDTTLTVSWNAVAGAANYHALYQADGAGDWLPPIPDYQNITATSFSFDIDNGKSYVVGVRAGNSAGWGPWTDSPTSNPPLPAAVGSITLTRSDTTLTVSWNAVDGAAKYHALYQADGAGDWLPPIPDYKNITATGFTFNVDNGKSYVVGVRAGNSAGWGPWTDSPASGPYTPEPQPPAAPAGLTARAGDGSVTLVWDDPGDSSITGYEYNVNHNDTGTGNFSGWTPWTAIPNSGPDTTSHTFNGLTNGREYRYHLRAVNDAGPGAGAPNAAPWFASATPGPVSISATEVTATTATIAIVNHAGDWYYQASGESGGSGSGGASAASSETPPDCVGPVNGQANLTQLGANTTYTVTAWNGQCQGGAIASAQFNTLPTPPGQVAKPTVAPRMESLKISWTAPTGNVTGYDVEYRPCLITWDRDACNQRGYPSWGNYRYWGELSGWSGIETGITPTNWEWTGLRTGVGYQVRVRAKNGASPGAWSEPSADMTGPQPAAAPTNVTLTDGDERINVSWTTPADDGGWPITNYDLRYAKCTTTGGSNTCTTWGSWSATSTNTPVTVTYTGDTKHTITGLDHGGLYKVEVRAVSVSVLGTWSSEATITLSELTAGSITSTSATLTLPGHSGNFWIKQIAPTTGSCSASGLSSHSLSTLTANTVYGYEAYGATGCASANLLDAAFFATSGVGVGNLTETDDGDCVVGYTTAAQRCAIAFTTGNRLGGYTLANVTAEFDAKTGTPGSIVVGLHAADTTNGANPAASATTTLTVGSSPDTAGYYSFTCSGNGCNLEYDATYFIVMSTADTSGSNHYNLDVTDSNGEDKQPDGNGWTIANAARAKSGSNAWTNATGDRAAMLYLVANNDTSTTALSASDVAATTATLTIANHSGGWYYKADVAPHTACQSQVSGATENLTGLTPNATYTYSAYSDAGCTNANNLATARAFTTPKSLTAGSLALTSATLTVGGHTGNWHYMADTGPHQYCQGPVTGTSQSLTGLTSNTTYAYAAFSNASCRNDSEFARATFTTPATADYDADDDGLIEISNLAQLNAMRWDLDGNGTASSGNTATYATTFPNASSNMGCNEDDASPAACSGYELAADLDFDTNGNGSADSGDTYWNGGAGWTPIGTWSSHFATTFDGGGYKLSNLHVSASTTADDSNTDLGGLFGAIGSSGTVRNLGLEDVDVTVSSTQEDSIYAGALAGENGGTVIGVWSTGSVEGSAGRNGNAWVFAGGLVGRNETGSVIRASYSKASASAKGRIATSGGSTTDQGTQATAGGLVGRNKGTIAASFATGSATADHRSQSLQGYRGIAGGLVGINSAPITASYARGNTAVKMASQPGSYSGRGRVGGLVGENKSSGTITASFSTGSMTWEGGVGTDRGGLVGLNAGTVTNSYWDTDTSGRPSSAAGTGKTTTELQTPTAYGTGSSIYASWNVNVDGVTGNDDPWEFGTASQYPILEYGTYLPASAQR